MDKRSLRVLLVEDDEDDFLLTRDLLDEIKTFECEVEWATNHTAAKQAISQNTFDVCLIDYRLGANFGLDFIREAAAEGFSAPMILLTGEDDHQIDLEAMRAGAADYLLKGKTEAALLERTIRYALAHNQAEEALQEAAKRERAMIENALDVICTFDSESRFVSVNPACFRMWGYQPEELIGRRFTEFVAPEDVRATLEVEASILSGSEATDFENRCIHKNGSLVNVCWTSYFSESEQLIFAVAHDITDRKQAEEAIRRSEEKYRNILETIEEGYFEADLTGDFTFFNDALCNLLGYSRSELIGLNYTQYVDEENAGKLKRLFIEVYKTNQSKHLSKWEIIRKNGEPQFHESSVSPIRNEKGKPIGFRGIVRDISERIRAEKELLESQQMLKLLIDTLPQAVWWKDTQGVYRGVNKFIANAAGFDAPEQMIGLTDYDMPWTKAEADLYRTVDRRIIESGVPELDMIETQLQFDGRRATVTTNKVPFRNSDGEIVGVLGTFTDITERIRADAALRESEYKLRTLLKSMREGLLQVDDKDCVTFVNDCFCEMVGYTFDELMGTNWTRLLFDEDGQNLVKQANQRRRDGISDSYELPLRKKSGERFWAIVGGAPTLDSEGVITGSMGVFTDITERKRVEQQLLHDAFHDALTGLANRTLFTEHLQMAIERMKRTQNELFAVLFLDFDRFKIINDSLGHAAGDNLLKQIARRLEASLRSGDLVARLGGDEFTILVNKLDDSSVALRIAERIQKNLQVPFDIDGSELYITASIGIALSTTGHERAEDMLRDADIAMYRAKSKGKAQHQVFDRQMHEQASKQLLFETEMRQALEREEFQVYYQPIMDLETERLIGFEALVRWKHPTRGMIPPFEFIAAAEENRLIIPLGQWILHESCRQLRRWQDENPAAADLTISVNLSSKQFSQSDLAEQIAQTLAKTGLEAHCLKLEITESYIMENTEVAVKTMSSLRALGVELSLDDFGTGYSSLSYLHRLPVSSLKIDRSFVTGMIESEENSEIVHTIIKLARNLKMKVVAEGIETGEQLAQLQILNCEFGQGYFIAKPMEANAAQTFINSSLGD